MRRLHWCALALLVACLAAASFSAGCGKPPATDPGTVEKGGGDEDKDSAELKPLTFMARGTLKGKVTVSGTPDVTKRNSEIQKAMEGHKDSKGCLAGSEEERMQQDWKIGADNGLAEVLVYLRLPAGQFFQLDKTDLELKDVKPGEVDIKAKEVVLDQPHCAFIPHVFATFPRYVDPETKKPKETGQKLIVKNSADFPHNTNITGQGKNKALGSNNLIPAKGQIQVPTLHPHPAEVTFKCDLHQWMNAYCKVFDHPFVAVTDKDGNFEIKDVPAGVDVQVVAWHPAGRYAADGEKGRPVKLKEGENTQNFEIKAMK